MAFLPRAGRHAAGPVWPLPAVPAAWHQAEPLIKQPPSAWAPTEPGLKPRSQRRGHQVGFGRRTRPSRAWGGHSGESLGLGSPWLLVQVLPLPAPQARQPLAWLSPYIWPRFPHLRAGGGRGQDSVVDGICGTRARPGPGSLAGGPVPRETVSESAAVAAAERQGPATPTGPGMRKERGEGPGPGAQTILISWPRFNPSPGLPGPPSTSSKGLA